MFNMTPYTLLIFYIISLLNNSTILFIKMLVVGYKLYHSKNKWRYIFLLYLIGDFLLHFSFEIDIYLIIGALSFSFGHIIYMCKYVDVYTVIALLLNYTLTQLSLYMYEFYTYSLSVFIMYYLTTLLTNVYLSYKYDKKRYNAWLLFYFSDIILITNTFVKQNIYNLSLLMYWMAITSL